MNTIKLMLNKSKSTNTNKSMYKINIRNYFLKSRVSNYYLGKGVEQEHRNDFNKLINR